MTSVVGRAVSTTAVIGGGALAAGGIAGAIGSPDDSQATDLTVAVAGGVGLAAGATALATTGRVGTVARIVGIGATALAGVTALVGFVGGTRRHEAPVADSSAIPQPSPGPAPTTPATTRPSIAPTEEPQPTTPTTTPAPGPTPTPTPTDPTPTPTPLTPKEGYAQALAQARARVDTVAVGAQGFVASDAQLAAIHPQYSQIFRHALNEHITPKVPVTGEANWTRVSKGIDTNNDGKLTFVERSKGGRALAHGIAAYSVGVDEKLRAGGDFSDAARIRAGEQLLKEWNGPVQPGQNPGDTYGVADDLLIAAGVRRQPDDSADWKRVAQFVDAKLASYGF